MKYLFSLLSVLSFVILNAQYISISELAVLNQQIKETSGLIYFNDKLITINDSGNPPFLYEIDTTNGEILRTVTIENATNTDWESLAQDSLYIYIADIGNNSGDRTNLKIYRVLKTEYLVNDLISADTISFSYNNQTDFTSNYRDTEFDAEALSVYNDSLIIFMKDWVNNTTRTYTLPKIPGTHIAFERNTYNSNGLITGSSYNTEQNTFTLCGYTQGLAPFIVSISDFDESDIFSGSINRIDITDSIGAGQTEGVCYYNNDRLFLSREEFIYQSIEIEPKLYSFTYSDNSSEITHVNKKHIELYPNPAKTSIVITNLYNNESIKIIDILGNTVICAINAQSNNLSIDVSKLQNGLYFVILKLNKETQIIKFIKI